MNEVDDPVGVTWNRICSLSRRVEGQFQLNQKFEASKQYAQDHPIVTVFLLVTVAMCSVPVSCFVTFAVGSMFLSFLGFMFVEGILLTLGSVILCAVLCIVGFLSVGFSGLLLMAWFTINWGHSFFQVTKAKIQQRLHQTSGNEQPSEATKVDTLSESNANTYSYDTEKEE